MSDKNELLKKAAKLFKTGRELMGSKWENCEAEVIAMQTICACANNLKIHGEAISWQGEGTLTGRARCGTDNAHGLGLLLKDDMIISEEFTGTLKPSKRAGIAMENGNYLVLRCTEKLLHYVIGFVGGKTASKVVR